VRSGILAALCGLGLLAAAGCGGGSSDGGETQRSAAADGTTANLDHVNSVVEKYTALPEFTPPGEPFDAKKAAGKHIFNIPYTSEVPVDVALGKAMADVAKQQGIRFTEYTNQGSQSQWNQGIATAINQGADLINLTIADPRAVEPALRKARDADIDVVSTQGFDPANEDIIPDVVTASTYFPFAKVSELMADWAIADTKGDAQILVVHSKEIAYDAAMVGAIQNEVDEYCGEKCSVTLLNVPVVNWASRIQPQVQAALTSNPDINYIIPVFDAMVQWAAPAVTAANKTGKVHITSFNGTPFALKMIQDGDTVRMIVGQGVAWTGWAAMDQMMRVLTGNDPVTTENLPLRMFTKDNVSEAGVPPVLDKGYGDAYIEGYKGLWDGE
jgi:ribose transport system substrate-binding protein